MFPPEIIRGLRVAKTYAATKYITSKFSYKIGTLFTNTKAEFKKGNSYNKLSLKKPYFFKVDFHVKKDAFFCKINYIFSI